MLNINNIRNHKVEDNFNAYSPLGGLASTNTHWYLPAKRKKSKEKKQKYSFLDKEVIYREGDPISKVYEIHSGLVKQINY